MSFVLPINTAEDSLEVIGGKGRSLSRLSMAGFRVPGGFQVTTLAYRRFVDDNSLRPRILEFAKPVLIDDQVSFENAASRIQQLIADCTLPPVLVREVTEAYHSLEGNGPAVAVRSSANAEDLPDLSFAGQQETYLNVCGAEGVIDAVRNCWASLWTAQAINYRHEMAIPQESVAMAVLVQIMVPADVSGVLFTANPTSGDRTEMIINGSFGLGEAIVSGQVTPDTYIVDRATLSTKQTIIGAKARKIVPDAEQGVRFEDVSDCQRGQSSLSEAMISRLGTLAIDVERSFGGVPQDIEWAISEGEIHLLQSRPITNLPPPPIRDVRWDPIPAAQLIKRQIAENMPAPLSPLFEDLYLPALHDAQTWPNYKNFIVVTVNGYAYQRIDDEGFRIAAEEESMPLLSRLPALVRGYYNFYANSVSDWRDRDLPAYLATIDEWRRTDPTSASDQKIMSGIRELARADARYWIPLRFVIGVAKMTDNALQEFLQRHAPEQGFTSGAFLSGFDSRTLRAEIDMRSIADRIRSDDSLRELVLTTPLRQLLRALDRDARGRDIHAAIARYLETYGHQVYNLDFAEPAQAEDPLPFLMSLRALVQHPGYRLDERQEDVASRRTEKLREANRFFRGLQWFKWRFYLWMARRYYPYREEAFFYMGAAWSVLRPLALELGRRLVETNALDAPDDVFFLTCAELDEAITARHDKRVMQELAQRAASRRELRQARTRLDQPQAIPPMAENESPLSTVRDNVTDSNTLRGFAVSPGTVTGEVSVILSPNDFHRMRPATILVCPLTTPAWTQLFPQAIGLVTDIGSILAHGSIVAREYGIPAVLGLGDITQRVRNGQQITIDGDRGIVVLLDG